MTEQQKATREAIRLNELVTYALVRSYKPIMNIKLNYRLLLKKKKK